MRASPGRVRVAAAAAAVDDDDGKSSSAAATRTGIAPKMSPALDGAAERLRCRLATI